MIGYTIFILAATFAMSWLAYPVIAQRNGWPRGEMALNPASAISIGAFLTMLLTLGKSLYLLSWWSPIAILVTSTLLGSVATSMLKGSTQVLCIVGVYPMFILSALYASEARPLGFLHRFF